MSIESCEAASGRRIGLYRPADAEPMKPCWDAGSRFSEFCREHIMGRWQARRKHDTRRDKQTSIDYFLSAIGDITLAEIDDDALADFLAWLETKRTSKLGQECLSPATIKKHVGNLESIIAEMGPRSKAHRTAVRALAELPMFPELRVPKKLPPLGFSLDELGRILGQADEARQPRIGGIDTAVWWRALLIVLYNSAMRISTILDLDLAWIADDGWVQVPPASYKRGELRAIYFNRHARRAIELVTSGRRRGLVFPRNVNNRSLGRVLEQLQRSANVDVIKGRKFHGLRRACATELARLSPSVAAFHLCHAGGQGDARSLQVVRNHYIDARAVTDWIEKLPQPVEQDANSVS